MMRMHSNEKGFTLIELLMVAVMLGLVMMAVYSIFTTSKRSANTQDDVVEVQQNLRIAMDNITRDIRNAGFMISQMRDASLQWQSMQTAANPNYTQPIGKIIDDHGNITANALPSTTPDAFGGTAMHADILVMNSASPFAFLTVARITAAQTGIINSFTVATSDTQAISGLRPNIDQVRIYNPIWHDEETNLSPTLLPRSQGGKGTVFNVVSVGTTTIKLGRPVGATDNDPSNTNFRTGDIIAKTTVTASPYVNWVKYCLGPEPTNCPAPGDQALPANTQCNSGASDPTMCLLRITNTQTDVIATKISGLQFTYLLDNGTEVSSAAPPADLGAVRAVRVTLNGQTATAEALSGGPTTAQKTRTMMSVVKLQNRFLVK